MTVISVEDGREISAHGDIKNKQEEGTKMRRRTAIGLLVAGILAVAPLSVFGCDGTDMNEVDGSTYTLTILKTGNGAIETEPGGLRCEGSRCVATFRGSHNVTLTGIPGNGEAVRFETPKCNGSARCTFALYEDTTITIHFEEGYKDQGQPGDIGC